MEDHNQGWLRGCADAVRNDRQAQVADWCVKAFTAEQARSLPQRGLRLLEEAIEAFQAAGGGAEMAHRLVDYVFARPVGELGQEIGGCGVALRALAAVCGLSADEEERREVERVLSKPVEEFSHRNAAKNAAGFLVSELATSRSTPQPPANAAAETWTDEDAAAHARENHPAWEYATRECPRKANYDPVPPDGDGWIRNPHRGRPGHNGWDRFDEHEEYYWMRQRQNVPVHRGLIDDQVTTYGADHMFVPGLTEAGVCFVCGLGPSDQFHVDHRDAWTPVVCDEERHNFRAGYATCCCGETSRIGNCRSWATVLREPGAVLPMPRKLTADERTNLVVSQLNVVTNDLTMLIRGMQPKGAPVAPDPVNGLSDALLNAFTIEFVLTRGWVYAKYGLLTGSDYPKVPEIRFRIVVGTSSPGVEYQAETSLGELEWRAIKSAGCPNLGGYLIEPDMVIGIALRVLLHRGPGPAAPSRLSPGGAPVFDLGRF